MEMKADLDAKYNILDERTPRNVYFSGHYKRSYAYYTLRSRLPVVLTNVIDNLTKDKNDIVGQYSEQSREELKTIIGLISKLKYELQTDKPFEKFEGVEPDAEAWNAFIAGLPEGERTFYSACWLHSECYMYRKLYSFIENSIYLQNFDYFNKFKQNAQLLYTHDILSMAINTRSTEKSAETFGRLLKLDLWSNRNDLIPEYENDSKDFDLWNNLQKFDKCILINNTKEIWQCLQKSESMKVDIICDNAGLELFTDLLLAEYLIEKKLATKVCFHVKAHPWFVTDTTATDVRRTLKNLTEYSDRILCAMGKKFTQLFETGTFMLAPLSYFWTGPYAYCHMAEQAPELYKTLSQAKLIIFKGDLNYRKLLGDYCWDTTAEFNKCLKGFAPTNICAIRTVKAETICGLQAGLFDALSKKDPFWMTTGDYGIIQFAEVP